MPSRISLHTTLKHTLTRSHLRHLVEVRLAAGGTVVAAAETLVSGTPPADAGGPSPGVWEHLEAAVLCEASPNPTIAAAFARRRQCAGCSEPLNCVMECRTLVGGNSNRVFILAERPLPSSKQPRQRRPHQLEADWALSSGADGTSVLVNASEKHQHYHEVVGNGEGEGHLSGIPTLVLREYGVAMDGFLDRNKELEAALLVADRGVAPPIYGSFADGRVERYLSCTEPATTETLLHDRHLLAAVMAKLRHLHAIDASTCPCFANREPVLFPLLRKLAAQARHCAIVDPPALLQAIAKVHSSPCDRPQRSNVDNPTNPHHHPSTVADIIDAEITWLETLFARGAGGPIVFAHNDLNPGNILFASNDGASPSAERKREVSFIDFEYAGWNYRAFDIGNVMCELDYCYDESAQFGFQKRFITAHPDDAASLGLDDASPVLSIALTGVVYSEMTQEQKPQQRQPRQRLPHSLLRLQDTLHALLRGYHHHSTSLPATAAVVTESGKGLEPAASAKSEPQQGNDAQLGLAAGTHVVEAVVGMLASHLLWATWAIVLACTAPSSQALSPASSPPASGSAVGDRVLAVHPSDFQVGASGLDYVHYGDVRLREYAALKDWFLAHELFPSLSLKPAPSSSTVGNGTT